MSTMPPVLELLSAPGPIVVLLSPADALVLLSPADALVLPSDPGADEEPLLSLPVVAACDPPSSSLPHPASAMAASTPPQIQTFCTVPNIMPVSSYAVEPRCHTSPKAGS
jgi:hypothetical protein